MVGFINQDQNVSGFISPGAPQPTSQFGDLIGNIVSGVKAYAAAQPTAEEQARTKLLQAQTEYEQSKTSDAATKAAARKKLVMAVKGLHLSTGPASATPEGQAHLRDVMQGVIDQGVEAGVDPKDLAGYLGGQVALGDTPQAARDDLVIRAQAGAGGNFINEGESASLPAQESYRADKQALTKYGLDLADTTKRRGQDMTDDRARDIAAGRTKPGGGKGPKTITLAAQAAAQKLARRQLAARFQVPPSALDNPEGLQLVGRVVDRILAGDEAARAAAEESQGYSHYDDVTSGILGTGLGGKSTPRIGVSSANGGAGPFTDGKPKGGVKPAQPAAAGPVGTLPTGGAKPNVLGAPADTAGQSDPYGSTVVEVDPSDGSQWLYVGPVPMTAASRAVPGNWKQVGQ